MRPKMTEQDILEQFFNPRFNPPVEGIILGPGDDCAVLAPPMGQELVVTTDTLVEGVHFFKDANPYDLGYKAIAVNLSDVAAMGARPLWILSNLTLPEASPEWLEAFSKGMYACCHEFGVAVIGGNLTRGPLVLSFTAIGSVLEGQAVKRFGSKPGDYIAVTGHIGEAAYAFWLHQEGQPIPDICLKRLHRPQPRVAVGQALRPIASSMIDITDGLTKDCARLSHASHLKALLWSAHIPLPEELNSALRTPDFVEYLISFGDDYELCFTLSPDYVEVHNGEYGSPVLNQIAKEYNVPITVIGRMEQGSGLNLKDAYGKQIELSNRGYDHFQKSN
jgi:thiamine-monophosphate kinase